MAPKHKSSHPVNLDYAKWKLWSISFKWKVGNSWLNKVKHLYIDIAKIYSKKEIHEIVK